MNVEAASRSNASASESSAERFSFGDVPRLTAALRVGDEEAFGWLHRQWNDRLVRYCFALARGDGPAAAEMAQAAYLKLYRHVRVLPDERALWNWIARAARCAATDSHRIGSRYRAAVDRFMTWLSRGHAAAPESARGNEEDAVFEALESCLDALGPEERSLIEWRYFAGLPLEEIGGRLNLSARSVEGRLARLRAKLRAAIVQKLNETATE